MKHEFRKFGPVHNLSPRPLQAALLVNMLEQSFVIDYELNNLHILTSMRKLLISTNKPSLIFYPTIN